VFINRNSKQTELALGKGYQ